MKLIRDELMSKLLQTNIYLPINIGNFMLSIQTAKYIFRTEYFEGRPKKVQMIIYYKDKPLTMLDADSILSGFHNYHRLEKSMMRREYYEEMDIDLNKMAIFGYLDIVVVEQLINYLNKMEGIE